MPAKLVQILEILEKAYGPQQLAGPTDAYEMIVFLNCGYPASDGACAKGFDEDLTAALEKRIAEAKGRPANGSGENNLKAAKKVLQQFPTIGEPSAEKILLFSGLAPVAAVPSAFVDVPIRLFVGEPGKN